MATGLHRHVVEKRDTPDSVVVADLAREVSILDFAAKG
jgi:hypothetical protein